jgi:hypothetical protein
MPSPKAFLRQIAQFGLDPKKAYTKSDVGHDGNIKRRIEAPAQVVKNKVEEPEVVTKEEAPKTQTAGVKKETPAAADLAPKTDKSVKTVTAKSTDTKKIETPTASQKSGVNISDENTVESKEKSESAVVTDQGTVSTPKLA